MEQQPDHDLLERVSVHDPAAFEALFARHHETVRHHLTRMLRDRDAVEDLTQEVFLRVWTRAEQWNGLGAFRSWVLRIATNLALNHLRTVRRRRELPLEPTRQADENGAPPPIPDWLIDPAAHRPDRVLEQLEWRERLKGLLERLSEEKREVFHLVIDYDMDVQEVADRLGIPAGTVRSRLHYARKQLARDWQDEWEER